MSSQKKDVKSRNINFTEVEKRIISEEVAKRGTVIHGEFSATLTNNHKILAWSQVADAVNAVAPTQRTLKSIQNKWKEMKRVTKQKVAHNKREMHQTGGGQASIIELTEVERIVETQIGKASLYGVGGMDSLQAFATPHTTTKPKPEYKNKNCPATITQPPPESEDIVLYDSPLDEIELNNTEPFVDAEPVQVLHVIAPSTRCEALVNRYSEFQSDYEVDDPLESTEPQKKRSRMRRPKEELQNNVIKNQHMLNKKMESLISTVNAQNLLTEELLKLKREKLLMKRKTIEQKAKQHKEIMDVQCSIAASLAHILSSLNK